MFRSGSHPASSPPPSMLSLKRTSHSISANLSINAHPDSDIDGCSRGKRRRRDNFVRRFQTHRLALFYWFSSPSHQPPLKSILFYPRAKIDCRQVTNRLSRQPLLNLIFFRALRNPREAKVVEVHLMNQRRNTNDNMDIYRILSASAHLPFGSYDKAYLKMARVLSGACAITRNHARSMARTIKQRKRKSENAKGFALRRQSS